MTDTQTPRPKRQDAQRNRETILAAAVDTFSQAGLDASLEAIARQAGVGIGTLYRHFPTRETLAIAAYQHEVSTSPTFGRRSMVRWIPCCVMPFR
jgi:AcrR family transcriptional regulator